MKKNTHVGVVHNNQRLKQYYQQIERKHSAMQKHSKNPKRIRCPGSVWKNKGKQSLANHTRKTVPTGLTIKWTQLNTWNNRFEGTDH